MSKVLLRDSNDITKPLSATSADVGKVVGVDEDGNIALIEGSGGGNIVYYQLLFDEDNEVHYIDGLNLITEIPDNLIILRVIDEGSHVTALGNYYIEGITLGGGEDPAGISVTGDTYNTFDWNDVRNRYESTM